MAEDDLEEIDTLQEAVQKIKELQKEIESLRNSMARGYSVSSGAINGLAKSALDGTLSISKLHDETEDFLNGIENLTGGAAGLINQINPLSKIFSDIGDSTLSPIKAIGSFVGTLSDAIVGIVDATDSITSGYREYSKMVIGLGAGFGQSLDQAREFGDYIVSSGKNFANAESGFISIANRISVAEGMAEAGIPLENMSKTIVSTAGSFDFLNTAFLQSSKMGMDLRDYMSKLSDAMNVQGLSAQQAFEQMAMYGDIAENTGLQVDSIIRSLDNVADNFKKMGMSASFGRPLLEGFTSSLNSMGLGFENALDLTASLGRALGELTTNYSAAYVTFQRGGLDFGAGGGAMGASIGLRAQLLDAEKRGDQSQLGMQMAGAMRDTLASFAGGDIVTVSQAAASPELQSSYIAQTELLKSMYNISDAGTQDRVLELLQQLGDATESGNTELAASLGEDLQSAIGQRDETLSLQEKSASYLSSLVAEQLVTNTLISNLNTTSSGMMNTLITKVDEIDFKSLNPTAITDKVTEIVSSAFGTTQQAVTDAMNAAQEAAEKAKAEADRRTGGAVSSTTGAASELATAIGNIISENLSKHYTKVEQLINDRLPRGQ